MENQINNPNLDSQQDENEISLIEILFRYLRYWKWFVVSIVVAVLVAFVYFRYTVPIYNVTSSVILKHEKDSRAAMGGLDMLDGMGMMGGVSSVENETYVIRSKHAVRTVIDKLKLNTSYMVKGRIVQSDMYTKSPFVIEMGAECLDALKEKVEFTAQLNEDMTISVSGTVGEEVIDTKLENLPALLTTKCGVISFMLREGAEPYYEPLHITINRPESLVNSYRGNLTIQPVSKTSSVLNLSIQTPYPNKGRDFLNTLVEVYNYQTIEDKNQEALNTRNFINERLEIIDRELSVAEGAVEDYKREQGMTKLEADLAQSMQQSSQYEQQLVRAESQLDIVNSLSEWVGNPANQDKPVPSNVGLQDPTLAATINEYNQRMAERERLKRSVEESNPVMQKLNEQIHSLRGGINSSIASVRDGLTIEKRNIANQVRIYSGKIGSVPTQERQFTEIAREQQIKASLYLLLLQKREENALALAATSNSAKTLDSAWTAGMTHPKKPIIMLALLLLGVLIPVGVIYLLDLLQYKIRTRSDVDRISKVPMLGEIPTHEDMVEFGNVVVSENATTELDEAFRILRTNLTLSLSPKDKVVVFTSTVPGEGKTFAAINTAISLALLGKKVLLVGMDFRLPRLHTYMDLPNTTGITTYLSGYENDIEKLILPSESSEHLSVMLAGPIPPNPAELLSRNTLDEAMEKLRGMYDYIIIDSAPVSLVSDTLILNRVSDATAYLCRANYSSKMNLKYANDLMNKGRLKNMLLVINDVKDFHRGYGYGYGYGYGNKKK